MFTETDGNKLVDSGEILTSELNKARQVKNKVAVRCLHLSDHINGRNQRHSWSPHKRKGDLRYREKYTPSSLWLPWRQDPSHMLMAL